MVFKSRFLGKLYVSWRMTKDYLKHQYLNQPWFKDSLEPQIKHIFAFNMPAKKR